MRNWVVKNDFNRAAIHKDKKKSAQNSMRKQKHKRKDYE